MSEVYIERTAVNMENGFAEKITPDVPLAEGLDVAAFGDDPMFVTLPIAQIGAVSKNGYRYAEAVVRGLVTQINQQKPEGHWGHVPAEKRDTHYQPPAVRWVGALMDEGGVVWAKAFPITPEAREHFRIAQAAHAPIGTSLYGVATIEGEEVVALDLESIDLADAARVGIAEAVAAPVITAEMVDATGSKPMAMEGKSLMNEAGGEDMFVGDGPVPSQKRATRPDESAVSLPELSPQPASAGFPISSLAGGFEPLATPDTNAPTIRQLLMEQSSLLRQTGVTIEADTDTADIVRGLIAQLAHLHAQNLLSQIQAIITETVKLPPLRAVIAEMMGVPAQGADSEPFIQRWRGVIAEMGAAENPDLLREAVRTQVVELMGKPSVQVVARALVSELAGPSVVVGSQGRPSHATHTWDTPEKRAEVRSRFGF